MDHVIKMINRIRSKTLKIRLFRELIHEIDFHYGDLLLHSNVCQINVKFYFVLKNYYHKLKFILQEIDIVYGELENIKYGLQILNF